MRHKEGASASPAREDADTTGRRHDDAAPAHDVAARRAWLARFAALGAAAGMGAIALGGCAGAPRAAPSPPSPPPSSPPVAAAPPPLPAARRPRIGLALGGGAARGFAHIGVIQALDENGFAPDLVVGTSACCMVAALFA
jgi:NTE family protein